MSFSENQEPQPQGDIADLLSTHSSTDKEGGSTQAPSPPAKSTIHDSLLNWWMAAGIVGADIGTSVFYSTGVIMPYVGFAAPLVILFVCLMMWFFKSTYEEGCSVSPFNGGAYIMVLQTVGRRLAMIVGALTILSYLATAAVSALSGAYYLDSFDNLMDWTTSNILVVAIIPVVLFGLANIKGMKEPAFLVFLVALGHFILLLYLDINGLIMAIQRNADFTIVFRDLPTISPANLLHGCAAAFLGITGFESAAQIVEQLKTPTWRTLKKVYLSIVLLVGITAPMTSYLVLVLLNQEQLIQYKDNLLSGLAYVEGGQTLLKILVFDACLTLFCAVNTAYVGCIGLCTTMAKQGNLPGFFLRRWDHKVPALQGYPYIVLTFMLVTIFLICVLPGNVEDLGQVYGMAFLAVMASFCVGVIMLRFRMPLKVARSPYKTRFTFHFKGVDIPIPPLIGLIVLSTAELVLIVSAHDARPLGIQTLLAILMVMCFYRLGLLESRLRQLPDLRLGLGKFTNEAELPNNLPTYVLCTAGAKARNLAHSLIRLLEREEPGPKEIILYHAEEESARRGIMYELLQRVVSQQIAPSFRHHDMILTVKILPESLVEGLIYIKRAHPFMKVFIGTGTDPELADKYTQELENNLGVPVINIGHILMEQTPTFARPEG
ncbi:MAG: APC family permease [Candidatus Melainabacteria bacterium]|nr:APC family permease [Candidatus Melainabacteria bacterium]